MLNDNASDDPPIVRRASKIVAMRVRWLWAGRRIPFGHLSRIDGDPGLGKSVLTIDIAARASSGLPMPGEDEGDVDPEPINVLLVAAEDDEGTIRDRLDLAGADLDRVHVITTEELSFPSGVGELEKIVEDPHRPAGRRGRRARYAERRHQGEAAEVGGGQGQGDVDVDCRGTEAIPRQPS